MDNDFPTMMAGERLGLPPLRLKEGLQNGSLHGELMAMRIGSLMASNPMAPEKSWPGYKLSGEVQPEVTYGA